MLQWMGLGHITQPKPPRASAAFRFFRRGLVVGILLALPLWGTACGALAWVLSQWH